MTWEFHIILHRITTLKNLCHASSLPPAAPQVRQGRRRPGRDVVTWRRRGHGVPARLRRGGGPDRAPSQVDVPERRGGSVVARKARIPEPRAPPYP